MKTPQDFVEAAETRGFGVEYDATKNLVVASAGPLGSVSFHFRDATTEDDRLEHWERALDRIASVKGASLEEGLALMGAS